MQKRIVAFVLVLASGACQVAGGYEPFHGQTGSVEPAAPHPCDVLEGTKTDELELVTLALIKLSDGTCFWIDDTEVTVSQYRQFLSEVAVPLDWGKDDTATCGWKATPWDPEAEIDDECTLSTAPEDQPFAPQKPIRCADWCDARAFCEWAGKSLCGGDYIQGGISTGEPGLTWRSACSEPDELYPYGGTQPAEGACNIGLSAGQCFLALAGSACAPASVPTSAPFHCQSRSGPFDMIGNVSEWISVCGKQTEVLAEAQQCQIRGGSFDDDLEQTTCQTGKFAVRSTRDRRIGFRCCDALNTPEATLVRASAP